MIVRIPYEVFNELVFGSDEQSAFLKLVPKYGSTEFVDPKTLFFSNSWHSNHQIGVWETIVYHPDFDSLLQGEVVPWIEFKVERTENKDNDRNDLESSSNHS